jgi:hypothetical protein
MIKETENIKPPPVHKARNITKSVIKKCVSNIHLSYTDFFKENTNLKKYKLFELKSVAKTNRLYITGTKPILILRITTHFNLMKEATKIQSIVKGYFVRRSFQLRGEAFKSRSICINETDFYTLERIQDIPFQEFFSYTDNNKFVYGFNIQSLIIFYRKQRFGNDILNPYNRDIIDTIIKARIFCLYNYVKIIFPDHKLEEDKRITSNPISIVRPRTIVRPQPVVTPQNTIVTTTMQMNLHENLNILHERNNIEQDNNNNGQLNNIRESLVEIRRKPIETRIQELFMEIDQLGHYTDCSWFNDLGKRNFYLFYLTLQELWLFRAHIPSEIKLLICPLGNPFLNIPNRIRYDEYTEEDLCRICLYVMENIILTSTDIEYRKIGTFHVLTALTVHSLPARNSMMWLYESIY